MTTHARRDDGYRTASGRRMRADARRNYDRLVEVANAAFDEFGADASLDEIARQADVSIATLYRHFPTRQDLIDTVFLRFADTLRDQARELLEAGDPVDAFVRWLRLHLEIGAYGRGLAAKVMSVKLQEGTSVNPSCLEMKQAGQDLLERAQATRLIRGSVDLGDLMLVVHGIVLVNQQVPNAADRPERLLKVVTDGLRTDADS
jgi:AcrR family transcriptional regulator